MNYQEALTYISSVNWKGSVPGLERITKLMHLLGDPQKSLRFVHIGGTNGKGSTAAFISHILKCAGYKTGLFISPFIEVFNERMQINNNYISNDELAEITSYIRPYADLLEDLPTEFELNTAIAMEYFKRNHCDIVVLEVGMGGEFDATNVISAPLAAVITAIGLDHTDYLGDTIEKITATKAGIIKSGCEAVLYKQSENVTNVIKQRCLAEDVRLNISEPENLEIIENTVDGQVIKSPIGIFHVKLAASYQKNNLALALKTIEVLNRSGLSISEKAIKRGVEMTYWPGRFEVLSHSPLFLVDGAHNPHGMQAAADSLKSVFHDEKVVLVFGVLADKDYRQMLDIITPYAYMVFCVTPDNKRALKAAELALEVQKRGVDAVICSDIRSAVRTAIEYAQSGKNEINDNCINIGNACTENSLYNLNDQRKPDKAVVALGSLYMIGDIKKLFEDGKFAG